MSTVSAAHDHELRELAADVALKRVRPDEAVELASRLVADGMDGPATVALAMQPSNIAQLRIDEVEPLVQAMLSELHVALPDLSIANWQQARRIAQSMISGAIAPPAGAIQLWWLWSEVEGDRDPLVNMLMLHDRWEESVGTERASIEREMVDAAASVIGHADLLLDP